MAEIESGPGGTGGAEGEEALSVNWPDPALQYMLLNEAIRDEGRRAFVVTLFSHGDGFDLKGWRDGAGEIDAWIRTGATPPRPGGKLSVVKP